MSHVLRVLSALALTTRTNDDIWQWDPKTWEVWGSNFNNVWTSTGWTRLGAGDTGLGNGRGASNTVSFDNTTAYKYYKVVFPTTKGVSGGKSYLHVSEARLFNKKIDHHVSLADDAGVRAQGVITTAAGPGNYLVIDRGANAEPLADYTVMFDVQSPADSRAKSGAGSLTCIIMTANVFSPLNGTAPLRHWPTPSKPTRSRTAGAVPKAVCAGETGAGISLASGWRRERNTSFIHNSQ